MFTGIVTDVGRVSSLVAGGGDARFVIETSWDTGDIAIGASISCSGACLTVTAASPGHLSFDASAETLSCTTLGGWREGTAVNLERAMRMGDEFGGHIVSGHVDAVARIVERRSEGDSVRFVLEAPEALMGFVAPKGSVAIDGVSLTVNEVEDDRFGVNIIPHTLAHTTFGERGENDRVNMEIDLLARYVARRLQGG